MNILILLRKLNELGFLQSNNVGKNIGDIVIAKGDAHIGITETDADVVIKIGNSIEKKELVFQDTVGEDQVVQEIIKFFADNQSQHWGYDYIGFAIQSEYVVLVTISPTHQKGYSIYSPLSYEINDSRLVTLFKTMIVLCELKQDHDWVSKRSDTMEYRLPDNLRLSASNLTQHWKTQEAKGLLRRSICNFLQKEISRHA